MDFLNELKEAESYLDKEDYENAYLVYLKLAKKDNVFSMIKVAQMLIHGEGVSQNEKQGYDWYKSVADKDNSEAQYYYGWYCLQNNKIDIGKSYLKKAIHNNNVDAMYDVAGLYAYGDYGYDVDIYEAIDLYKKACLLSKKEACIDLYIANKKIMGKKKSARYMLDNIGFLKCLKILTRLNKDVR